MVLSSSFGAGAETQGQEMKIVWHGAQFEKQLAGLVQSKLKLAAEETRNHVKEKLSEGRRGSVGTHASTYGPGTPPHVDTGRLRNSIFWDLTSPTSAIVGTPLLYGLFMELGADVRPKKGKYLAIPWSAQAKRHSQSGGSARDFSANGKKLRKIGRSKNTFFLVEDVGGKSARSVIHYIITDHAHIPAHPFLRPSLDEMRPRIQEIFRQ